MEKKTIFLIILMIIIALIIGCLVTNGFFNEKIKVGNSYFVLPNDYMISDVNSAGDISITKGNESIYIGTYDNDNGNITKYVQEYCKSIEKKNNKSVLLDNFTINNIFVYKTTNLDTGANHYWFVNNNEIYTIYTWNENPNADVICKELINKMTSVN